MVAGCSLYQIPATPAAPPASTREGNTIMTKNFAFDLSTLTVKTGTVVMWVN
jgi:plastocyanin